MIFSFQVRPWEELTALETFLDLEHFLTEDKFVFNEEKGFYCITQLPSDASEQWAELIGDDGIKGIKNNKYGNG